MKAYKFTIKAASNLIYVRFNVFKTVKKPVILVIYITLFE